MRPDGTCPDESPYDAAARPRRPARSRRPRRPGAGPGLPRHHQHGRPPVARGPAVVRPTGRARVRHQLREQGLPGDLGRRQRGAVPRPGRCGRRGCCSTTTTRRRTTRCPTTSPRSPGQAPNITTQTDCQSFSAFTTTGPDQDGQAVGSGCVYPETVPTLPRQLTDNGLTWRGYMQQMRGQVPAPRGRRARPDAARPQGPQLRRAAQPVHVLRARSSATRRYCKATCGSCGG